MKKFFSNPVTAQWATVFVATVVGFFAFWIGLKQNSINREQVEINKALLKIELIPSISMNYGTSSGEVGFILSNNGRDDISIEKFIWKFNYSDRFKELNKTEEINEEILQGDKNHPIPEILEELQGFMEQLRGNEIDGNVVRTFTLELAIRSKADDANLYRRRFDIDILLEDYRIVDVPLITSQ